MRSEAVVTGRDARLYWLLVLVWVSANLLFWTWWLQPQQIGALWFYVLFSLAFAYEVSFLPAMYLFYLGRMRSPRRFRAPPGLKVALITLCVPSSESLEVIVRQMEALVRVQYPHDRWILDEGNDPRVREAAERFGVRYFTRKGIERYNQPGPPFQAKTKAGNVNAWLDVHGKEYDFFVQFDIDHVPEPEYLERVLGFFRDPEVAWVQAPSVYGNRDTWVARGAAEQELVLQGPLQRGFFGASETPFIIGSHATYRTSAIMEIGGFQPTRAEDHLDTVVLASRGYRGVFVPEIIAVGEGPDTFETYLRQQFAWAYSMMQVLFTHTPRLMWRYRPAQMVQFLFAQTWYTFWSTSTALLFLVPLLALLTSSRPATVSLPLFMLAAAPLGLGSFTIWWWSRRWHIPFGLMLSWRGVVLHIARWPIVLWALINVLLRIKHPYMITPKGERDGIPAFSMRAQVIYLLAAWLSLLAVWVYLLEPIEQVQGYLLFALSGSLFMMMVVATNVVNDLAELRRRRIRPTGLVRLRSLPLSTFVTTLALFGFTVFATHGLIVEAATWVHREFKETGAEHGRQVLLHEAARAPEPLAPTPTPTVESPAAVPPPATPPGMSPDRIVPMPVEPVVLPMPLPEDRVAVGAYDPWLALDGLPLDIEHWYVRQDQPDELRGALARTRNERTVLATIEPFPSTGSPLPVLDHIVAGAADEEIRELARIVADSTPQKVLVRWAHEMDLSGLYPWSANDPELYVAAYRRVVDLFEAEGAANARWVWSPAGNPGSKAFYPGDDVVDYIGVTVLGDEGWDEGFGLEPQSFRDILQPRYERMEQFGKPVLVAELGVSGTKERQAEWLQRARESAADFPLLRALVYFNDVNAPHNRLPTQPDWRLESDLFQFLLVDGRPVATDDATGDDVAE